MPATASAPAGSTIERLSSKMSWIAAQISSVLTMITSSTYCLRQPERLLADPPHGDAVGEDADAIQRHALARLQRVVHRVGVFGLDADDADLRKQILHVRARRRRSGRRRRPATKIASIVSPGCWRRISMPIVPWPAITSGSSNGWMKVSWRSRAMPQRVIVGLVVVVAVQDHLAAEIDHRLHLDAAAWSAASRSSPECRAAGRRARRPAHGCRPRRRSRRAGRRSRTDARSCCTRRAP